MPRKANAQRYAQAVFEIALEKNEPDRWQSDLETIAVAVKDGALMAALESPKIKLEQKAGLISGLGVGHLAVNLVLMLITRSSVGIIGQVAADYRRLLNAHRGIETAEVVTAVPLEKSDEERLAKRLSEVVGAEVELQSTVQPEILGGIVARIGGKLLDGSTRSKLIALKRELVGTERKF